MDKKKSLGIVGALLLAIAGGSYAISLDFSQTTSIVGDTITTVTGDTINNFLANEGITLDDLRSLCASQQMEIFKDYEKECALLELLP